MSYAVVYYSNTNESKRFAKYFADKLDCTLYDIYEVESFDFDNLVLVFPIHCQSLPQTIIDFLQKSQIQNLTLIATYGRMCHGNALYEAQHKYPHKIVAAAYIPTRHSYLQDGQFDDFKSLDPLLQKILSPSVIKIPKSYKNPFSNVLKKRRSQLGVKIIKTDKCSNCGICSKVCSLNAIKDGVPNKNCIRCLKCVNACPNNALTFKLSPPMKAYLKKKKQNEVVIYL